jgi:hypothetical protein
MEVPVKPVCPKLDAARRSPALLPGDGVSQPKARLEPTTMFWRSMKA